MQSAITDRVAFEALWRSDMTVLQIAGHYGLGTSAVHAARKRLGFEPRGQGQGRRASQKKDDRQQDDARMAKERFDKARLKLMDAHTCGTIFTPPGWSLDRDIDVLRTGGRCQALRPLAKQLQMPFDRVQARWHVVRVAV